MPIILQPLGRKNQSESVLESPDMGNRQTNIPRLFLASNSPRRRELMTLGGWEFNILTVQVDETPLSGEGGIQYVQRLAESKLMAAVSEAPEGSVVVAADTTVVARQASGEDSILGKPRHRTEAIQILRMLRGRTHQVHTAISILNQPGNSLCSDLCTTDVPMRAYSDEEIEAYVGSGDPMDKAGAYAIQHAGFHPVEHLDGCYANVMGLPLCHLTRNLIQLGIPTAVDVPNACQDALGYRCPVFHSILGEKTRATACRQFIHATPQ